MEINEGNVPKWQGKQFSFFANKECEYFPCHTVENPEDFNCLFCFCPLYMLNEKCNGDFTYTKQGVKDCGGCIFPHKRKNYGRIIEIIRENPSDAHSLLK